MADARPAPVWPAAAGVLFGLWLDTDACVPVLFGAGALLAGSAAVASRHRGLSTPALTACLVLAGIALGLARGESTRTALEARQRWLPAAGYAVETHLVGRVIRSPRPTSDGARRLVVRAVPERRPRVTPARIELIVHGSRDRPLPAVDGLLRGDVVRVWVRLGRARALGHAHAIDPQTLLAFAGLDARAYVKSPLVIERGTPGSERDPARWLDRAGRFAGARLEAGLRNAPRARALAGAILLGRRELLDGETMDTLRRAGLAHLVAISGLHVGLLIAGTRRVAGARGRTRAGLLLGGSLLVVFAVLVGGRSWVWRAVVGASVGTTLRGWGRTGRGDRTLLLLAVAMAFVRPASIGAPGFQLTFLATAGLLRLAPAVTGQLPGPRWLASSLGVSGAVYVATAPVLAWHFGAVAPNGLATNLVAVPLCAALMVGSLAAMVCGGRGILGAEVGRWCEIVAGGLLDVSRWAAGFEPGYAPVARPSVLQVALYAALAAWIARRTGRPSNEGGLRAFGCFALRAGFWCSLVALHVGPLPPGPKGRTEIVTLDVGQGAATVVRGPSGGAFAIDAGGDGRAGVDPGRRVVLPFLARHGTRRLEAVVVTHGDHDHAGGVTSLIRGVDVGELWLAPGSLTDARLHGVVDTAVAYGTAVVLVWAGRRDRIAGVPIEVLAPERRGRLEGNEGSLVLRVGRAPSRLLVTGDIGEVAERALLASGRPLRAEALAVAHHGSRHGSIPAFLERVRPRHAVVSAGFRNRFGHPHEEVLAKLRHVGARVARTDLHGSVRLIERPGGWHVSVCRRGAGPAVRINETASE